MRIIFASHNTNKVQEIRSLLPKTIELLSLEDIQYHHDIEETGATLEENSKIKAATIFQITGIPTIADDTGLEVFSLQMAPGVYSARYAGAHKSDSDNIEKLLSSLANIEDRRARFRTGFGYDPIFVPENLSNTFAEMSLDEKNKISHRARALSKLVSYFQNMHK
jgi:XTP/dITP diphosphohydrolase